jgi:hypothetical protein
MWLGWLCGHEAEASGLKPLYRCFPLMLPLNMSLAVERHPASFSSSRRSAPPARS